jgi:hypothetical protein
MALAKTQGRKYAFMLAMNISTGDDPEADESTDKADNSERLTVNNYSESSRYLYQRNPVLAQLSEGGQHRAHAQCNTMSR